MADRHPSHEWERTGFCRRCGLDSGDIGASEPCRGSVERDTLPPSPGRLRTEAQTVALEAFARLCDALTDHVKRRTDGR